MPGRQPALADAPALLRRGEGSGHLRARTADGRGRGPADQPAPTAGVQRAGFDGIVGALGFYEHLGVSRDRILAMATTDAAAALGVGEQTGRVTPGYTADLLVVDGSPLEDLAALSAVRAVFANGRQHQAA